jgi:hypothetical protein
MVGLFGGFSPEEYFQAEQADRAVPKSDLSIRKN